jgi:predicted nucleic acid-binding protein
MADRIFVDSNIWVYLFTADEGQKNQAAHKYISKNEKNSQLVVSYQVVNEVCCVLKKKNYTEQEIRQVADDMMGLCEVCAYSGEVIFLASELREKYPLSYWDSQIVASALISNCAVLASEDMQDGQKIESLMVVNVLGKKPEARGQNMTPLSHCDTLVTFT